MTDPELIAGFRTTERTLLAIDKAYHLMTREEGPEGAVNIFREWLADEFEADALADILTQVIPPQAMAMIAMDNTPERAWASFYAELREQGIDPSSLS